MNQHVSTTIQRFPSIRTWANCILRIDLSEMTARSEPSSRYVPEYLGSRGLAARICWDDYPEPIPAFDPANPLMVVPGALTGSRAPYSGRTTIHAFSPQAWPYEWFTRSSIGGHFGGELKRAGYDALIITGAAETPVRIVIRDDVVSILPADGAAEDALWGLDIFDTLEALDAAEGRGAYHLTIGPAGENLSRIATIQTGSSSAAGQGGFGAVMGSSSPYDGGSRLPSNPKGSLICHQWWRPHNHIPRNDLSPCSAPNTSMPNRLLSENLRPCLPRLSGMRPR